jgi:hypothetical protein
MSTETLTQPDFRFEWRWKEELVYHEGDQRMVFYCGWAAEPPIVFVPTAAAWDDKTAGWLRGRRDEIVERIERHSGHVVMSVDWAY